MNSKKKIEEFWLGARAGVSHLYTLLLIALWAVERDEYVNKYYILTIIKWNNIQ